MNEVLEFAEDIAIDIPKIWDYLSEILSSVVSKSTLPLSILSSIHPPLVCKICKVVHSCKSILTNLLLIDLTRDLFMSFDTAKFW